MNIFPNSINKDIKLSKINTRASPGTKDILFDTTKKRVVIQDGDTVITSIKEQIKQWLFMLIHTEIDKYKVYEDTNFGLYFLYAMKGHDFYSSGFTIAQIKQELTDKIERHEHIEKVTNIDIDKGFNNLIIKITLQLQDDILESEVIYDV